MKFINKTKAFLIFIISIILIFINCIPIETYKNQLLNNNTHINKHLLKNIKDDPNIVTEDLHQTGDGKAVGRVTLVNSHSSPRVITAFEVLSNDIQVHVESKDKIT